MAYKALSPDDPTMAQMDFDRAYSYPLSSVQADLVYNSLLTGRPYFLQMIEDAEVATRFVGEKLGLRVDAVTAAPGNGYWLAKSISEIFPGVALIPQAGGYVETWSAIVLGEKEIWPIQYLMPSGAYIH